MTPEVLRTTVRHLDALAELVRGVGEPVAACRDTAAALLGMGWYELRPPFHLLVPEGRRVNRVGHVVHTSRALDPLDLERVDGMTVTSPTRTIVDLAATLRHDRLVRLISAAIGQGLTSEEFLHRRLADLRRPGRGGTGRLLATLMRMEVGQGRASFLEREFRRLLRAHRVPLPTTEVVLGRRGRHLIRVDCHWPGTRLVVELLGYRFHRDVHQMGVDAERMNRLNLDGYRVLQFTYLHVMQQPAWTVSQVTAALARLS